MNKPSSITRYNQPIPQMLARMSSSLRLGCLTSFFLAAIFLSSGLSASNSADAARQLAHKIAAAAGPGAFALDFTNHSSLDEKSVREVRSALEAELHTQGVHTAKTEQAIGAINVVLSESLRDYVWTAEIAIGSDEKKVVLISLPRSPNGAAFTTALPIVLKTTLVFAQSQPILDLAQIDMPGGSHLLVLGSTSVAIYRQTNTSAHWDLETSLPISHSRTFPRDLRGRILIRRDHLFDVYLPGTLCRSSSSSSSGAPLTIACNDTDDPWPLTPDDNTVHAFFAASRNFFTGALSPAIGKISNVPSFYSAVALPKSNYTLWAFAAVDGSLHFVDGITDQSIRGSNWGSDLAGVRSSCGTGTQLLATESGDAERDGLRAYEIPDRDPVAVSSAVEFAGQVVALWPEPTTNTAVAIVKRKDTGWYESYRIQISCN